MEVPRVAGQNDNAAGWICFEVLRIESIAQADVKETGNDRVNSILRVLYARGHLDPDQIRPGLSRLSNKHGQSGPRRKRRKRLPVNVFRENRFENGFAWLVVSNHYSAPNMPHRLEVGQVQPRVKTLGATAGAYRA